MKRERQRGQILPLFALMLVALFAMAALAIDVSQAYAALQSYRTTTDAAALAGGQQLQGTKRAVSGTDRASARALALESLGRQLEPANQPYVDPSTVANCDPANNIPPGPQPCVIPNTGYEVRITTPVASCVSCDVQHSIAVSLGNPNFQLSFSHVLPGFDHWNVSRTSIAGLQFSADYALVTLRPPKPQPNGADQNLGDIDLTGGSGGGFSTHTTVNVINGDVGTNTYVTTNSDTIVNLLDGYPPSGQPTPNYRIYHWDQIGACGNPTTACDTWNKDATNQYPVGWKLSQLVNDPQYITTPIARPTGSDANLNITSGLVGTSCNGTGCSPSFTCSGAPANFLPNGALCFKPGVYPATFKLTGTEPGAYLQPGVYFFDNGIQIGSGQSLWGGLQDNSPGVAIVVPQNVSGSNKGFDTASATVVDLNGGDPSCATNCSRAAPAQDVSGRAVATPQGLAITIYVPRDPTCFTGAVPQLCNDNQNKAVTIGGNSAVIVSGVIYGPSDQMNIASNSTNQNGRLGQIISWTVDYTGHATLNQEGPPQIQGGQLRLDGACTAPGTACSR
jgi:putative Flp pilus-assembly TadE/G-like protein